MRPVVKNGFVLSPAKTDVEISRPRIFADRFALSPCDPLVNNERRVLDNSFPGKQVRDARIAAAMNSSPASRALLTFNTKDFKRFQNCALIDPNFVKLRM